MRLPVYRALLEGFEAAERWDLVQAVAQVGAHFHPHSWQLQHRLERAGDHVVVGPTTEDRAEALVAADGFVNEGAEVAIERLHVLVENEEWDEADAWLRAIRRARPEWLPEVSRELDRVEARAVAGRGDLVRLRQLAPGLLQREVVEAGWLVEVATTALADGTGENVVRSLLQAVLREAPDDEAAIALSAELTREEDAIRLPELPPVGEIAP